MIFDISDQEFRHILEDEKLYLPIRWDGRDFVQTLETQFQYYLNRVERKANRKSPVPGSSRVHFDNIKRICGLLTEAVKHHLNGFPSRAYDSFKDAMELCMLQPLKTYHKSVLEQFEASNRNDLNLFRVTAVDDNRPYPRERVFHTPYTMRSKVSTTRYSIAGYPSLYLGTSLELCCQEIHYNPHHGFALASVFELERVPEYSHTHISVIDLGIKPQDFIGETGIETNSRRRRVNSELLGDRDIRSAYLLWYPLIAACSYIRVNKEDPFAAEYIIPQLLMQWVRSEMSERTQEDYAQLMGIRYFSCASVRASDMGFDYVFPTSGKWKSSSLPYCAVLAKALRVSEPVYIHEFDSITACERHLKDAADLDFIGT